MAQTGKSIERIEPNQSSHLETKPGGEEKRKRIGIGRLWWRGPAATAADCKSATRKQRWFESTRHHYPFGCKQAEQ